MYRGFFFGALLLIVSTVSQAEQDRIRTLAMSNLGHETIECAAYYLLVSEMLKTRADSTELAAKALETNGVLFQRALIIADGIGQKWETVQARFQMSVKSMWDAVGGNASNASILLNRYGQACKIVADNVEARIQYWMDQAIREQSRLPPRK